MMIPILLCLILVVVVCGSVCGFWLSIHQHAETVALLRTQCDHFKAMAHENDLRRGLLASGEGLKMLKDRLKARMDELHAPQA